MYYLQLISFIIFLIQIVIGYKKDNRNIMLFSSLCLFVGLGGIEHISDFYAGFINGYYSVSQS